MVCDSSLHLQFCQSISSICFALCKMALHYHNDIVNHARIIGYLPFTFATITSSSINSEITRRTSFLQNNIFNAFIVGLHMRFRSTSPILRIELPIWNNTLSGSSESTDIWKYFNISRSGIELFLVNRFLNYVFEILVSLISWIRGAITPIRLEPRELLEQPEIHRSPGVNVR